jgi:uncharacterized membrane protein
MKPENIIIEYPDYPITGYLAPVAVGVLLSISMGTIAWHYPELLFVMLINILLSWILVVGVLVIDHSLHMSQQITKSLLQYIKVRNVSLKNEVKQ